MMATAAVTATASAAVEIALFRHTAQFEGLADVLRDGLLHFLHVLLRIQEAAGDRVLQERLPQVLEIGDLAAIQRKPGLLFLLQQLAFDHQGIVLSASGGIGHEGVDPLAQRLKFRLVENRLAKFLRLLDDHTLFNLSLHNLV